MAIEGLPRVFKISDIAERWECSEHHVRKVIETGELRAFRIGKLWRVRLDAIDEYEARAAIEPEPPRPPDPKVDDKSAGAAQLMARMRLDRLKQERSPPQPVKRRSKKNEDDPS